MSYLRFKAFTSDDWMGFMGAEAFKDNDQESGQPVMADIKLDGEEGVLVADKTQVGVYVYCDNTGHDVCYALQRKSSDQLDAVSFVSSILSDKFSVTLLTQLGFEQLH